VVVLLLLQAQTHTDPPLTDRSAPTFGGFTKCSVCSSAIVAHK